MPVGWCSYGLIADPRALARRRRLDGLGLAKRFGSPISARARAPVRGPEPAHAVKDFSQRMLQERRPDVSSEPLAAPDDPIEIGGEIPDSLAPRSPRPPPQRSAPEEQPRSGQ